MDGKLLADIVGTEVGIVVYRGVVRTSAVTDEPMSGSRASGAGPASGVQSPAGPFAINHHHRPYISHPIDVLRRPLFHHRHSSSYQGCSTRFKSEEIRIYLPYLKLQQEKTRARGPRAHESLGERIDR